MNAFPYQQCQLTACCLRISWEQQHAAAFRREEIAKVLRKERDEKEEGNTNWFAM